MKKLWRLLAVLGIVVALALPTPVYAIDDPDSPPQVSAVYVYEDLLETGDAGVLIDYYLDYDFTTPITGTPVPDETVTEAFLVVFIDTDGSTQLKSVSPYTFANSGYGRGLVWIYFSADEVTTYGLDSDNQTLYSIWLVGNPTLSWVGDPPKTTAGVDYWQTTGDPAVLLALRVLYYADVLELIWSLDMVEATSLGSRLTSVGENYFENVITNLRTMAPAAFSAGTYEPVMEDLDYSTSFGAVVTSGTATITGSPITLAEGANPIAATTTGNFTAVLERGTAGIVEDDTGTVTGSPVDIVYGTNTITVTGAGNLTITVNLENIVSTIEGAVVGTGFDLTVVAARFGMSRWMFSSLVWMVVTAVICAGVYKLGQQEGTLGGGKIVMLVFTISIIGGALLGLLHPLVSSLLFIAFGAVTGHVIFFKGESLHKGFMFMMYMFVIASIAGNVAAGNVGFARTQLTANIDADDTTITVSSTEGFPSVGIIVIGDERIAYSSENGTAFSGNLAQPVIRGAQNTEAVAHTSEERVSTVPGAMLNTAANYHTAVIADAAGLQAFLAKPVAFFALIGSFLFLPLKFLGTDLQILTVLWAVIGIGMTVALFIALAGGRRV